MTNIVVNELSSQQMAELATEQESVRNVESALTDLHVRTVSERLKAGFDSLRADPEA